MFKTLILSGNEIFTCLHARAEIILKDGAIPFKTFQLT